MNRVEQNLARAALEMLAEPDQGCDEERLEQACKFLRSEFRMGRLNQQEFAETWTYRRLAELFSVRADLLETPQLRLVKGDL